MAKKKEILTVIIILLTATGLFFRDVRPIFAAFSLSLIILTDLYILNKKTEEILGNFTFRRDTDNKIVIRGNSVSVETEFDINIPDGIKINVKDLIPAGSVVSAGTAGISSITASGRNRIEYDLLYQAHGANIFEGIKISFSDRFFSKDIILQNDKFREPEIMVYPKPSFIKSSIPSFSGKSTDKKTIIKGEGVKGLREYNIHDDIRTIDWKTSAKYDKLYVREYSGLEREIQTVIIDLPDSEDPLSEEKAEAIKGLAGSILMNEDRIKNIKIILISGPNLIETIRSTKFHEDVIGILKKLKPAIRDRYLYRFSPKNYSRTGRDENPFVDKLSGRAGFFFRMKSTHIFEKQIYSIFGELGTGEEIFVFALPEDETSHLRIINEMARIKKQKTCCFIPANEDPNPAKKFISSCGFDEVNVI